MKIRRLIVLGATKTSEPFPIPPPWARSLYTFTPFCAGSTSASAPEVFPIFFASRTPPSFTWCHACVQSADEEGGVSPQWAVGPEVQMGFVGVSCNFESKKAVIAGEYGMVGSGKVPG